MINIYLSFKITTFVFCDIIGKDQISKTNKKTLFLKIMRVNISLRKTIFIYKSLLKYLKIMLIPV
jgi:hypothetical protein